LLIIRQERPSEYYTVSNLVKLAFQTAKVSNGTEQNFVDKLRESSNYIPELALVAEQDGKIVGHIMLTKTTVATSERKIEALLIAPLSVALEYRSRGIGSKLVLASFDVAKNLGYSAVFVVGAPEFYGRFGFKTSVSFGIRHVPAIGDQYVMAYELTSGALSGITGTVTFT
jgi:predicted N-acetyltransferase YhbS